MNRETGSAKTIVIVEDHPVMRRGLAAWFAGTGRWKVLGEAATLEQAAALLFSSEKADAVVLDIQLDGAWGLDLLPRLRERFGSDAPVVVAYSAFDDWAHLNAALSAGARGYVSKKTGEEGLETALRAALAGTEYVEPSLLEQCERVSGMVDRLTRRETEVFRLAREGLTSRRIGSRLGISPRTVDNILSFIYDKTGIRNRKELEKL